MKKNYIAIIIRIIGIAILVIGILGAIIPMFSFNAFTYNLGRSIVFAFGFTFVGIVLIVGSIIYSSFKRLSENNPIDSINDIANKIKTQLDGDKEKKKAKKCPYCGGTIDSSTKCHNCGATLKDSEKKDMTK